METIPRILTSVSQGWVAWLMLLTLIGLALVDAMQPGHYYRALGSLFSTKERDSIFSGSGNDYRPRWVLVFVGILILGLCLQWLFAPNGSFPFSQFAIYSGLAAAFVLVKYLMQGLVKFTFFQKNETDTYVRHYRYLSDCLTLFAWPVLLCALFVPELPETLVRYTFIGLLAAYSIMVIYKQIACFRMSFASALFIFLYFTTTEIVPAGMLIAAAHLLQ
ncbi:MAG: DUF4271 domain-containing protein [Paludibacteraceae bacterium]